MNFTCAKLSVINDEVKASHKLSPRASCKLPQILPLKIWVWHQSLMIRLTRRYALLLQDRPTTPRSLTAE